MVFLFPFVVSLTLKYYLEIPILFEFLLQKTDQSHKHLDEFYTWLDRRFNSYWVSSAALALTIGLNMIYFYQIFQHQEFTDWDHKRQASWFSFDTRTRAYDRRPLRSPHPDRPRVLDPQFALAGCDPGMGSPRAFQ